MAILKLVFKKSIFIIIPAIVLAAIFIADKKVLPGIFAGWLFGILNLRQLSRNVEGAIGSERITFKLIFLSMIRLMMLFAAIFALIYFKTVNIFGLLFGFTVVFILILTEGARVSKSQ
jgi:hypothetical protein